MRKPIPQIQSELVEIIANVAMISVNGGDNLDKQCKSNAIQLLKMAIADLDEHKNK